METSIIYDWDYMHCSLWFKEFYRWLDVNSSLCDAMIRRPFFLLLVSASVEYSKIKLVLSKFTARRSISKNFYFTRTVEVPIPNTNCVTCLLSNESLKSHDTSSIGSSLFFPDFLFLFVNVYVRLAGNYRGLSIWNGEINESAIKVHLISSS